MLCLGSHRTACSIVGGKKGRGDVHHAQDRASLLEIMHSISFGSLYPDLRCLEGHLNDRFVKHPVLVPGKMWSRNKERQLLSWYVPAYKVKWNEHSVRAKHLMRCIEL